MEADTCSVGTYARFRPPNARELADLPKEKVNRLDLDEDQCAVIAVSHVQGTKSYSMDGVFAGTSTQVSVYNTACSQMIEELVEGYNATIFAYGQTGAGKSYTMFGADDEDAYHLTDNSGVIPRAANDLFERVEQRAAMGTKCGVSVSLLEIYQESVQDLLNPTGSNLRVRESPTDGVYVESLMWIPVASKAEIMQQLAQGMKHRHIAHTQMNAKSSRSHSLFMVNLEQEAHGEVVASRLCLADLAGSEKVKRSGAEGVKLDEAASINQSLSTLGHCIMALSKGKGGHVPYRDSKLTFILKDSLGGNSKTALIIACSPHYSCFEESISTLQFAQRAKSIQNIVTINRMQSSAELQGVLEKLRDELSTLRASYAVLEQQLYDTQAAQASPGLSPAIPVHMLLPDMAASPRSSARRDAQVDPQEVTQLRTALQKAHQERTALASEMLAAAQLQNEAQQRCSKLQATLNAQSLAWKGEREDLEQRQAAVQAKDAAEAETRLAEVEAAHRNQMRDVEATLAEVKEEQKRNIVESPEVARLTNELAVQARLMKDLEKGLENKNKGVAEAEKLAVGAEAEKEKLLRENVDLFEAKKELAEKLSRVLMGGQIPEMREKEKMAEDERATLEAQVVGLQDQLAEQAELMKEMEARYKSDIKKATVEMSQHAKKQQESKKIEMDELRGEIQEREMLLERQVEETKEAQLRYDEQCDALKKRQSEKEAIEEKLRDVQAEMRVKKLEYESQVDKLNNRIQREKARRGGALDGQNSDDAKLEAHTLRTEVLRLRTVVSNVLKEKELLEASVAERGDACVQIEALRSETQRLQDSAKKASDDAKKAHSMKDELSVTLTEMEENFWKVAEKKLAATWSSPQSARNYFPQNYLDKEKKKKGTRGSGSASPSSPGTPLSSQSGSASSKDLGKDPLLDKDGKF